MKIHVFKRPDGSLWADFADLGRRPGHFRHKTIELATRGDMESLIADPGDEAPERVRALAERLLAEHLARNQQPPVQRQTHDVAVAQIKGWGFGRRLRWLVTGR